MQRDETPEWFHEYSFRKAYGTVDLSPAALDALTTRMSRDPALLRVYWQNKVKQGDPSLAIGCDNECLAGELCALVTTWAEPGLANGRCAELSKAFWETVGGRRYELV